MHQRDNRVSEWCKKDGCWIRLANGVENLKANLDDDFWSGLVTEEQAASEAKAARKTQKIDNGIDAQKRVFDIPAQKWVEIRDFSSAKKILSPKEAGVVEVACKMPSKIPTEKQCQVLLEVLQKVEDEGLKV